MGGNVIPLNKGSKFEIDVPWKNSDGSPADLTGFAVDIIDVLNTGSMTLSVGGAGNQFVLCRMTGANALANLLEGPNNTFRIRLTPPGGEPVTGSLLVINVR